MEANSQKTIHTFKPIYPQITKINLYQIWDIAANLKPKMTVSVIVWWGIKDIFVHCKDEELDLPSLYWIPKLHKCPFKQRLYCWVCQMLHETSFQIINMYSIGSQNQASELLWH